MGTNYKREIMREYSDKISEFKNIEWHPTPQNDNWPIWVFWWQGEASMPSIVKCCYNSIKHYSNGHPVNLITSENYKDYLGKLPYLDDLISKIESGIFNLTSLSDILRCYLLYHYGGLWTDATILITRPIDEFINNGIFTSCMIKSKDKKPSHYDCSAFFMFSCKGNPMYKFVYELLADWVHKNGCFSCYFMVNYCILIAYENFKYAHDAICTSPIFPNRIHYLVQFQRNINRMSDTFDSKIWNRLIDGNPFIKFTYKIPAPKMYNIHGELTYWGYIKSVYLNMH